MVLSCFAAQEIISETDGKDSLFLTGDSGRLRVISCTAKQIQEVRIPAGIRSSENTTANQKTGTEGRDQYER